MNEVVLGIDLGTTNSMAACVSDDKVDIVENEQFSTRIPSVVTIIKKNEYIVGKEALSKRTMYPTTTFFSFKRFIGRGYEDLAQESNFFPFYFCAGERGKILLGKENPISPEELSAIILKSIKNKAEKILNTTIKRVVITVPAYFDDIQRQATHNAAKIAGLEVMRIINEPTAAAIAYGLNNQIKESHVIVYDLGGGTFDISILKLKNKVFKVLSTQGNTHLGGDDFDNLLTKFFTQKIQKNTTLNLDSTVLQQFKTVSEEIKIALTSQLEVTKEIVLPHGETCILEITRDAFSEIIRPLVDETFKHIRNAMKDAQLKKENIDEIVLVGGSTKIPLIRHELEEFFQKKPHIRINPDEAVAIGSAIQSHSLAGGDMKFLLLDVIPLSLGIETIGNTFSKLILRNNSLPIRVTEQFSTSVDNQTSVEINIYQGEREFVRDCRLIGKFILRNIPPMPAGLPRIEVEFFVDANGILTVNARECRSNISATIDIIPSHGLKQEEVEKMTEESILFAEQDFSERSLSELKQKARSILQGVKNSWKQAQEKEFLSKQQQYEIEQQSKKLEEVLLQNKADVIKKEMDVLSELTVELADILMSDSIKTELHKNSPTN